MDKVKKYSQILKLSLIAALLFITPLLSSSLRTTYLYFIINILIIALGAEAGLLSFFSKPPHHDKKISVPISSTKPLAEQSAPPRKEASIISTDHIGVVVPVTSTPDRTDKKPKAVEKSASDKTCSGAAKLMSKVRKSPSTPSIFFIGGGEAEAEAEEAAAAAAADIEDEDDQGEELFTKAETFIGNFYKQLKMQREDSWKRLHELYQKAF